jgi:hypothetical protein
MTILPRRIAVAISVALVFIGILITSASSAENIMQQLAAVQARERAMQLSAELAERAARPVASLASMAARHSGEQRPIPDHRPIPADGTSAMGSGLIMGPGESFRGRIDKGGPGHGGR